MCKLLRDAPVHVAEVGTAHGHGVCLTFRFDGYFEPDVECLRAACSEVRKRLRVLCGSVAAKWFDCVDRHHPRRDRSRKALAEKRPERHVLPFLDIPCAPVVNEGHTEDVIPHFIDSDGISQRIARSGEEANLELKIKQPARTKRRRSVIGLQLSARPPNSGSG